MERNETKDKEILGWKIASGAMAFLLIVCVIVGMKGNDVSYDKLEIREDMVNSISKCRDQFWNSVHKDERQGTQSFSNLVRYVNNYDGCYINAQNLAVDRLNRL